MNNLDIVEKALTANRESKHVDFKEVRDPISTEWWCEIVKDIVAMANSGGGVIVFGLDNMGRPCNNDLEEVSAIDPADISDKVCKYTGYGNLEVEIRDIIKEKKNLVAFIIKPLSIPIVFEKPGLYDTGLKYPKSAFARGTIYFRHGAKSEPGTNDDINKAIKRYLDTTRKSWLKDIGRVVKAPQGSRLLITPALTQSNKQPFANMTFRSVADEDAIPVHLTRDPNVTAGLLVREELAKDIFDDINNVIETNRLLMKGQKKFIFTMNIYQRIYAQRHEVTSNQDTLSLLFHSAIIDFYAPGLYWLLKLPNDPVAETFTQLFLNPKSPNIYHLLRTAMLIGPGFTDWLHRKWHDKWARHPQPPQFYWTFDKMKSDLASTDPRLLAARMPLSRQLVLFRDKSVSISDLLDNPSLAVDSLTETCLKIYRGHLELKSLARELDYIAYGAEIIPRGDGIAKAIYKQIGDQQAGEFKDAGEEDV